VDLNAQHARILASLIEKAETTPDHYPLTTRALQAACNQTSNRDPVVDFNEREVDALMLELRQGGLARTVSGTGHRVGKHKHIVDDALGLDGDELAVLAVLMLRGAQTLNQLTTRTERYARGPSGDTNSVNAAIDRLAARDEPLVARLDRQSGEREPRVAQCWAETTETHESGATAQTVEIQERGDASVAREFWKRIETLHAVTYFGHESIDAATGAGLRGFWMGYFGFRAAPLGAVTPGTVEAAFANFAPSMVRRSLPDAWDFAQPEALVGARAAAAAVALRRLFPDIESVALLANDALADVIEMCDSVGRPMFAANRDVRNFDDPVAQLWQCCTTLREHRGDGHVIALAASAVDGCEAHHLLVAEQRLPPELLRDNRGWTIDQWEQARRRLQRRGLLDADGLTDTGRRLRTQVEALTDSLALTPLIAALGEQAAEQLIELLTPAAQAVAASGVLPFPNPMGLPPIDATSMFGGRA
jgi:uncharacterized protein YceH (UPF0502 family)